MLFCLIPCILVPSPDFNVNLVNFRLIVMSPVFSRKPIACSTPRRTRRKISGQIFSPIYEVPISEATDGNTLKKSRVKPIIQGRLLHTLFLA